MVDKMVEKQTDKINRQNSGMTMWRCKPSHHSQLAQVAQLTADVDDSEWWDTCVLFKSAWFFYLFLIFSQVRQLQVADVCC